MTDHKKNETSPVFVRDIEPRVLEGIVLQILSKIEGIGLIEGNIFESLLGGELERAKGIYVEEDQTGKAISIRVEINVAYGVTIPEKASEVQSKLSEGITCWTGLDVSAVHVVFKELISPKPVEESQEEETLETV